MVLTIILKRFNFTREYGIIPTIEVISLINEVLNKIKETINKILSEQGVSEAYEVFDVPKDPSFGDYSTNIAMRLAKVLKKAP